MKKSLILTVFVSLFFSCSKNEQNDSSVIVEQDLLIKQILTPGTSQPYQNFIYVDNKLDKIEYFAYEYKKFTYTGNLITHIYEHHSDYGIGYSYSYDGSNRLINLKETKNGEYISSPNFETDYQHNSDGTISFSTIRDGSAYCSGLIYLSNNQVYKRVTDYVGGSTSKIIDYTSDSKNFYAKNILGYKNIAFTGVIGADGVNQNITSTTYQGNKAGSTSQIQFNYTYNSDNYPETATVTYISTSGSSTFTNQYIYQ
jgi:hypothetical protein